MDSLVEQHEFIRKMDACDAADNGVVFRCSTSRGKSVDIRLSVCTPYILRFQMCPSLWGKESLLEIKEDWDPCAFELSKESDAVSVDTGAVCFRAQRDPWHYAIYDQTGEVMLRENVRDLDAHTNYRSLPLGLTTEGGEFRRSNETFNIAPGESFYGFGEKFTRLNKLGQRIDGWNKNPYGAGTEEAYKNIPFFMSTKGYGIFVNSTHRITYSMGSQSLMTFTLMIDDPRLDLFLIYGPSLKEVLARYHGITGWPVLPPKESFGIFCNPQVRQGDLGEALSVARRFRELDIPVDHFAHVISMTDPRGMSIKELLAWTEQVSEELGKLGIKTGLYVAPLLIVGTELEQEARAYGYALTREDGSPYEIHLGTKESGERGQAEYSLAMIERDDGWRDRHNHIFYRPCLMPDFTNPAAVNWWKDKIVQFMKAGCYSIIMSDFGEDVPADAHYYNARPGREMHNLYTLLYQKASFEAVAEGTGHRGLINARSGTAGLQRYPICWSGDPNSEWQDMLTNLRAGLGLGLSGVPFWSCDNGGFHAGVGHLTPELWIRWSQWSLFTSHTRLHGTGPRRVPWTFGQRAVENFRKYAKLRYRLLPYIYSQAYKATQTGLPMMRAMVLEFQDDPNTRDMEDQYLFGDAFLVAPVYTLVNRRTVYLPGGTWYDYYSGAEHQGPTTLYIEPPLDVLPLYVRGDSIIPMGPDMSYVGERPWDPIILDIWLCRQAETTIYDDDEIVGCRATRSGDGSLVLEVSASKGNYLAMLNKTCCPSSVKLNAMDMPQLGAYRELEQGRHGWYYDPSFTVYARFDSLGSKSVLTLRA